MRAQRWCNLKQQKGKDLVDYIDSEAKLYAPLGSKTIDISHRRVSVDLMAWLMMITPTLLPFVTESKAGEQTIILRG